MAKCYYCTKELQYERCEVYFDLKKMRKLCKNCWDLEDKIKECPELVDKIKEEVQGEA